MEEGKLVRAQLELAQVKADIDRRIHEKEEEFEVTRLDTLDYTAHIKVAYLNSLQQVRRSSGRSQGGADLLLLNSDFLFDLRHIQ